MGITWVDLRKVLLKTKMLQYTTTGYRNNLLAKEMALAHDNGVSMSNVIPSTNLLLMILHGTRPGCYQSPSKEGRYQIWLILLLIHVVIINRHLKKAFIRSGLSK